MPINGVISTLPGQQDLYKGFATKNKEEFSLENPGQKTQVSGNTNTSLVKTEDKKTFWDQFANQVTKKPATANAALPLTYEERLSDIKKKGDLLVHHPLPGVVKDYLKTVKDFLNDARENAYTGNMQDGVFKKLDIANEKLAKLADQLLQEQKPKLDLVASLGELQGCLVDIFV